MGQAGRVSSVRKGRLGEDRAAAYLEAEGFDVVGRNVRWRGGEVDVVARKGDLVVFCEVKRWETYDEEAMEYAVDGRKRHRIITTARAFLADHCEYDGFHVRFDVIFVGRRAYVRHIPGAFTES